METRYEQVYYRSDKDTGYCSVTLPSSDPDLANPVSTIACPAYPPNAGFARGRPASPQVGRPVLFDSQGSSLLSCRLKWRPRLIFDGWLTWM
jgi:hypothetical protein